jgi:S-adenosylmethionine-diacylglycerol 3-amino-3-carboxypropyl transferase
LALRLGASDRVLVITSAGCNALDYAAGPARCAGVDANRRQTGRLELMRAGIGRVVCYVFFRVCGDG